MWTTKQRVWCYWVINLEYMSNFYWIDLNVVDDFEKGTGIYGRTTIYLNMPIKM